ncbi:MAG: peptidoglycan-binding protein [Flavobacteriales bacterium]
MAFAQSGTSTAAEYQTHLSYLGFEPGGIDGRMGGGTRAALRLFQLQNGLPVTGRPNNRTRQAIINGVNRKITQQFGKSLDGEYGTTAGCRVASARFRIRGLHVLHLPTWTDQTFDYTILPDRGNRFRIVWEANDRLEGQFLQYESNRDAFRTPELNMIALSRCNDQSNDSSAFDTPTVPSVPSTPIGSVEEELRALEQALTRAAELRQQIRTKLEQRNGEFGSMAAQIASLEANLNAQQTQSDELRQKLRRERRIRRDAQSNQEAAETALAEMTEERDQLLAENEDLATALNNNQSNGGGNRARLRRENTALRQEVQRLTALLTAAQQPKQKKNNGLIFKSNDGRFQFSLGGK